MMRLLIGYRKGALGMNNLVQKVSEYMQEHHMVEECCRCFRGCGFHGTAYGAVRIG